MGVNSLWKALDEAGCGKRVGADEMCDPKGLSRAAAMKGINPWNVNRQAARQQHKTNRKAVLAVDLSIWICESLSSAMAENHANPAVHLVFSRTVKLLSMGIGLVFVIEGKRRIRDAGITNNDQSDKFRKRRSGTAFWKACRNCHDVLKLMGVAVVRAKAEAEALCALLNQKGIVDGVISNDGDCLLFGAKVVYTKFSIENLENKKVKRYQTENLFAAVAVAANNDGTELENQTGRCKLSRQDLIAFAILTGSDLAGMGLEKVGHKKAIRFIQKCQFDNPLHAETAAIDELNSWAKSIAPFDPDPFEEQPFVQPKDPQRCCSRCNHPGSKSGHLKDGCKTCGTQAGEPCLEWTAEERFRQSLRTKALSLFPKFDPSQVVEAYMSPNDNLLPVQFSSQRLPRMERPNLAELMKMKFVVRGHTKDASKDFIRTSIGRLLSRAELLEPEGSFENSIEKEEERRRVQPNKPIPLEIEKRTTVSAVPSYVVSWRAGATATDEDGNDIGGYQYTTVEPQILVEKRFPKIVEAFIREEKERMKQGDGEKIRRRAFLDSLCINVQEAEQEKQSKTEQENENDSVQSPAKKRKKRHGFFNENGDQRMPQKTKKSDNQDAGDDVGKLLRGIKAKSSTDMADDSSLESWHTPNIETNGSFEMDSAYQTPERRGHSSRLDALYSPLFCCFGHFLIRMSPVEARARDDFPPRRIYIHNSRKN